MYENAIIEIGDADTESPLIGIIINSISEIRKSSLHLDDQRRRAESDVKQGLEDVTRKLEEAGHAFQTDTKSGERVLGINLDALTQDRQTSMDALIAFCSSFSPSSGQESLSDNGEPKLPQECLEPSEKAQSSSQSENEGENIDASMYTSQRSSETIGIPPEDCVDAADSGDTELSVSQQRRSQIVSNPTKEMISSDDPSTHRAIGLRPVQLHDGTDEGPDEVSDIDAMTKFVEQLLLSPLEPDQMMVVSLQAFEKEVESILPRPSQRSEFFDDLAAWFEARYVKFQFLSDLDEAIARMRKATQTSGVSLLQIPRYEHLSSLLQCKYMKLGAIDDLNEAIRSVETGLQKREEAAFIRPILLRPSVLRLVQLLELKYEKTQSMDCLEKIIYVLQKAADESTLNRSLHSELLHKLWSHLRARYIHSKNPEDLEEIAGILQTISKVALFREYDAERDEGLPFHLSIAEALSEWRDLAPSDVKLRIGRQILGAATGNQNFRLLFLLEYMVELCKDYEKCQRPDYEGEVIALAQEIIPSMEQINCPTGNTLAILAKMMTARYKRTHLVGHFEEASKAHQRAMESYDPGSVSWRKRCHDLLILIDQRYLYSGSLEDLDEGIRVSRLATETPSSVNSSFSDDDSDIDSNSDVAAKSLFLEDKYRCESLNSLGAFLGKRFKITGSISDLDEAICVLRSSLRDNPNAVRLRSSSLVNIGNRLGDRFKHIGAEEDLEEAINCTREGIALMPPGDPGRPMALNDLASRLANKAERSGSGADREASLLAYLEALEITPPDFASRPMLLHNLGQILGMSSRHTGLSEDLLRSLNIAREALETCPDNHPGRALILFGLGNRLNHKYSYTQDLTDCDASIDAMKQGIDLLPLHHPLRAGALKNIGDAFNERSEISGDVDDRRRAYVYYDMALRHATSPILHRIHAAEGLLSLPLPAIASQELVDVSQVILELVEQLVPSSLQNQDKHHLSAAASGLASSIAAIALINGQSPLIAVLCLERGRGLMAATLQDMRTDLLGLRQQHPGLAASFEECQSILDAPIAIYPGQSTVDSITTPQTESDKRCEAHQRLKSVLIEIRQKDGFHEFLEPLNEEDVLQAADQGPVIIINVSHFGCEALIVRNRGVECVPLNGLTLSVIEQHRSENPLLSLKNLQWLWKRVVQPVLSAMSILDSPTKAPRPRVWWIPTGPLVGMPFHAAGYHLAGQGETALDHVISSYATSLRSLKLCRQLSQRKTVVEKITEESTHTIALVAMENTPSHHKLVYASEEVESVSHVATSMGLVVTRPEATASSVVSALKNCDIFHFAGHGITDKNDAMRSRLLLQDHERFPLTVGTLLSMDLQKRLPYLAYLSTCGSSQILQRKSYDESLHISNAFQLAGFRHVISTLWDVEDHHACVDMSLSVYESMQLHGLRDDIPSLALHETQKRLRDEWVRTTTKALDDVFADERGPVYRKAEIVQDCTEINVLWAPYIHYGC